jgi:hypothetical protein
MEKLSRTLQTERNQLKEKIKQYESSNDAEVAAAAVSVNDNQANRIESESFEIVEKPEESEEAKNETTNSSDQSQAPPEQQQQQQQAEN